jgi:hypothetical protein
MVFGAIILAFGVLLSFGGLLVEAIAMLGLVSYRVRRALPANSPLTLQNVGACCFFAGMGFITLGNCLIR